MKKIVLFIFIVAGLLLTGLNYMTSSSSINGDSSAFLNQKKTEVVVNSESTEVSKFKIPPVLILLIGLLK